VLLLRVRWTVEEGLAVNCSALFELLLHLIGYHLLTKSNLCLHGAMVVVNCTYLGAPVDLPSVLLIDFVHETVLFLTLQGTPNVMRSLSVIVFGSWLRQRLHLFFHPDAGLGLLSLGVISSLYRRLEEIFFHSVA
jgi:hypothetical protein